MKENKILNMNALNSILSQHAYTRAHTTTDHFLQILHE